MFYNVPRAVSGRPTAPALEGSTSGTVSGHLFGDGRGSHGRRLDVGVDSRVHRSIWPREQGSVKAILRDGLRPGSADLLSRQRGMGTSDSRSERSRAPWCPDNRQLLRGRIHRGESALRDGDAQVCPPIQRLECHPGEGVQRSGLRKEDEHRARTSAASAVGGTSLVLRQRDGSPSPGRTAVVAPRGRAQREATGHLGDRHTRTNGRSGRCG
jgi:hypothetical protein